MTRLDHQIWVHLLFKGRSFRYFGDRTLILSFWRHREAGFEKMAVKRPKFKINLETG